MCYFKKITKVDNINEIQTNILRIISRRKENFNYQSILDEVKTELRNLGVSESIADSYMIDNMVGSTLERMIEVGSISYFNNVYIPHKGMKKRVRYAFG